MTHKTGWQADRAFVVGVRLRLALSVLVLVAFGILFGDRLLDLDVAGVGRRLGLISAWQWLAAAAATALSYWAVGQYDRVTHIVLATGVPAREARRSGIAAIAIGQATGLGAIVGGLVRWRLLPRLSLWQATRVATCVALSFLAGLAVVAALLVLLTGAPEGGRALALGGLAAALALPLLALFPPAGLPVPPVKAMLVILALVAVDCAGTTLALAALMPVEHLPSLPVFATASVLALGAGLVSGTPGGIGPFEATPVALLPMVPDEPLLAAVVAFRLVYHLGPGLIAAAWALLAPVGTRADGLAEGVYPPSANRITDRRLAAARRAEASLVASTGLALHVAGAPAATVARAGSCLVGLGDPWLPLPDVAQRLDAAARGVFLLPILYKVGADTALRARRAGWRVVRVADEAWLDPRTFRDDAPGCRQLRRRLRKAEAAGLRVVAAEQTLPMRALQEVDGLWTASHGPARGFSMGPFPGPSLTHGRTFLAWHGDRLVAFASFHAAWGEWTLDLMRDVPGAPEGAMPLLLRRAIDAAAAEGVPRLSLAAVPRLACHLPRPLGARFDALAGTEGLTRFKASFAPRWEPLYAAAPGPATLALGLVSIARAVRGRS
jgi:phosphatidylglycerol lysyltransferase